MSDIKQKAREMFDKKWNDASFTWNGDNSMGLDIARRTRLSIRNKFIDQIIDLAIAERDKEIVEMMKNKSKDIVARHLYNDNPDLCVKINKDIENINITNTK